jgi:hypothetical protein
MKNVTVIRCIAFFLVFQLSSKCFCQSTDSTKTDSTKHINTFSGTVGISTNGFSIIPTFSLNSPAATIILAWRWKRLSFEPDIRLVPNASKGGMLWWLRYRVVDNKKFNFRVGTHPAFTLIRKPVTENTDTTETTEMLRFIAFELVPGYQLSKNIGVSAMYLQGNALQHRGPQLTRVLFLNETIENIELGRDFRFAINPSVYFLYTDGYRGDYLTVTGILSHKKLPFSLQSTINQTFKSDVPGNEDFMWNVTLNYSFNKNYKKMN